MLRDLTAGRTNAIVDHFVSPGRLREPQVSVRRSGNRRSPDSRRNGEFHDGARRGDATDLPRLLGEPKVSIRSSYDSGWPRRARCQAELDHVPAGRDPTYPTLVSLGKPNIAVRTCCYACQDGIGRRDRKLCQAALAGSVVAVSAGSAYGRTGPARSCGPADSADSSGSSRSETSTAPDAFCASFPAGAINPCATLGSGNSRHSSGT